MHIEYDISKYLPTLRFSNSMYVKWKGKRRHLVWQTVNNNCYFASTLYMDSKPILSLGCDTLQTQIKQQIREAQQ